MLWDLSRMQDSPNVKVAAMETVSWLQCLLDLVTEGRLNRNPSSEFDTAGQQ